MRRALAITFLYASCAAQPHPTTTHEELLGRPPSAMRQSQPPAPLTLTPADPELHPPAKTSQTRGPLSQERITLDVRDVEVREVLRLLASHADANIVLHDSVRGRVTLTLRDVTLDDAWLAVLQSQGLGYEMRGSVVLVSPTE